MEVGELTSGIVVGLVVVETVGVLTLDSEPTMGEDAALLLLSLPASVVGLVLVLPLPKLLGIASLAFLLLFSGGILIANSCLSATGGGTNVDDGEGNWGDEFEICKVSRARAKAVLVGVPVEFIPLTAVLGVVR